MITPGTLDQRLFFVWVARDLARADLVALDHVGVDVRHGVQATVGPWQGEFPDARQPRQVLRLRARDECEARRRVDAALGGSDELHVLPAKT